MFNKRILTPLIIILLLLSIVVMGAPNYVNLGPTSEITGDVGVPADKGYYIGDVLFSTGGLVDIGALAKTDGGIIVGDGTNFVLETGLTARTSLGLGNVENLKVKLDGTQAPTINNDVDEGYAVGSRWFDVTNDKEYVCLDNTDGAAVWTETTGAGGGANTFLELTDTPVAYDNGKYAKSTADGIVWDTPSGGYTNLTFFVDQTAWRLFYSNADGDVIELPFGTSGQYLKSNGATSALTFDTPSGGGDMLKATYDVDEDGDIDVAAGGTEKSLWTLYAIPYLSGTTAFGEIPIGTAGQVLKVNTGATGYEFGDETGGVDTSGTPEANDYARFTDATTIEGRSYAEVKTDLDLIKCRNNATTAPTVNDDSGDGYAVNSVWTDITNDKSYICVDATVDSAVWKEISPLENFDFYNALASDHLYSGDIDSQPVGESVVFGDLLYFNWADKEWKKTDADASTTMPGLRIALETKADGETCLMLVKGYIRDDSAFEFAGSMVYAGLTAGAMTSTAPSTAGNQLQRVGQAKSADILFFDPSIDVGEVKGEV